MRRSDRSEGGESIPGRLPPQREWRRPQPTPARSVATPLDDAQRSYAERALALEDAHRRRGFRRALFLQMWARQLLRAPRPATPRPLPRVRRGALGVTFVGHATVFLRYHNTRILTDPNLGRWLLAVHRAWDAGLSAQDLTPLDLVLVSHAHHDHLVRSSLRQVARGATCVVPVSCADLVGDLGFERVVELAVGSSFQHGPVEIVATPAHHWGTRLLGDYRRRGYCGYVVRGEGPSAYFAGDTAYFSGFSEIGRRYRPDVALLPIGAYSPPSFRQAHMSPLDAVYAFEDLRSQLFIPIHFGSFPLSYEPLDEPAAWLEEIARQKGIEERVHILENGQSHLVRL